MYTQMQISFITAEGWIHVFSNCQGMWCKHTNKKKDYVIDEVEANVLA